MKRRDLYYERIQTKLFRENVRYLGNILGRVIKQQEGERFFQLVEKIRKLSKANKTTIHANQTNRKVIRAIPWVFAWTQIRLMLPAWLGSAEALRYSYIKEFRKTLYEMERNWPFFNSMLDMLDMVISKADPEISKIYEEYLADENLKRVGKKLRFQFDVIKKLNRKITPAEISKLRKEFRTSVIVRSIYSEVLNIIQPIVISKLKKNNNLENKKYLNDALLTSIAGISAAMKNTG